MDLRRFEEIIGRYRELKVVVAGDFCLDRYLHIDPSLEEVSLETNLPAHQVVRVRPQGGGAGNVLANVAAQRPGGLSAVGVAGLDGEGAELAETLAAMGADLEHFVRSRLRITFAYTKPLVIRPGEPPEELSRLDIRDRTPMPGELVGEIIDKLTAAACDADVVILMEQVTDSACGVLSAPVKRAAAELAAADPDKVFLADSRCDVGGFANVHIKVNRGELHRHFAGEAAGDERLAARWAGQTGKLVFVTRGSEGIFSAGADGKVHHVAGLPADGPIDIVGAGDTVLAHLALALGAGASAEEAMALADLAAGIVIRKIGTTGTADADELRQALQQS